MHIVFQSLEGCAVITIGSYGLGLSPSWILDLLPHLKHVRFLLVKSFVLCFVKRKYCFISECSGCWVFWLPWKCCNICQCCLAERVVVCHDILVYILSCMLCMSHICCGHCCIRSLFTDISIWCCTAGRRTYSHCCSDSIMVEKKIIYLTRRYLEMTNLYAVELVFI